MRALYYPEIERLVKRATAAQEVLIFDHTIRGERPGAAREPVRRVHNDYTERSGPRRLRDLLAPEAAARRLAARFAQINVWRPIIGPVQSAPLAVADARTIRPRDLIAVDLVYPERTGEIYEVTYSPDQRWYYVPRMRRDEVLLIKGYDSAMDGRARFTPHTAFDHPCTPAGAPPRESIEVRVLAFFEPPGSAPH